MAEPVRREKMRSRRRPSQGLREVRLVGPDPRDSAVRARIAEQIKRLDPHTEEESIRWIEAVSIFDETR